MSIFKLRLRPEKNSFADKVKQSDLDPDIKEVFLGKKTVFSLMGFIVGGILFGNGLWLTMSSQLGIPATMIIGFILFIISGILSQEFRK